MNLAPEECSGRPNWAKSAGRLRINGVGTEPRGE